MQLETAERKEEIDQWLEEDITKYYPSGQNVTDFLFFFLIFFCIFPNFPKLKNYYLTFFNKNKNKTKSCLES